VPRIGDPVTLAEVRARIADRFGLVPAFFMMAHAEPPIVESMFSLVEFAVVATFPETRAPRAFRARIKATARQQQQIIEQILSFARLDGGRETVRTEVCEMDALVEPFTQLDEGKTREYGGTGLGLAITKGLVELLHGEIRVRARDEGGSTLIVALPYQRTP
jgi:signal transduction histidine kinase